MIPTDDESIRKLISDAYALERDGDVGAAVRTAREAVDLSETSGLEADRSAALTCMAYLYDHLGRFDEALELCDRAVELSPERNELRVEALLTRGICLSDLGRTAATEESLLEALDIARELGLKKAIQRGLHLLSSCVYLLRGRFDLAIASDEESLRMAEELELDETRWLPLITLGWAFWTTGRRRRALEILEHLKASVQPFSLGQGFAFCLEGDLTQDGDSPEQALVPYRKARSIADVVGDPGLGAELRTGLSRFHRRYGSPATALQWARDALEIAERSRSSPTLGWALLECARCFRALDRFEEAETAFDRAIDHAENCGARFDLARTLLLYSAALLDHGPRRAADLWNRGVDVIREGGYWFLFERERDDVFSLIAHFLKADDPGAAEAARTVLDRIGRIEPPPLDVTMLGSFEVRRGRRLIPPKTLERRRSGDLLRLLLLRPRHRIETDRAMEILWPEKPPSAATANLHQATSALRRALEPDLPDRFPSRYLKVRHGRIELELPEGSTVDFEEFERRVERGEHRKALDLYTGDLQTGYLDEEGTARGEHLRQRAIRAALEVASERLEADDPESALDAALRAVELEPWQEQAVLLGMRALTAMGNRAGAVRLYRRLAETLSDELGIEPCEEVRSFAESMLT